MIYSFFYHCAHHPVLHYMYSPPTAVVVTRRSPGDHVYYPLSRDKALLTSILIGCGRSRRLSCRARGRLHARRGRSAARAVAIHCGRPVPMANDVRTCDRGARGLLGRRRRRRSVAARGRRRHWRRRQRWRRRQWWRLTGGEGLSARLKPRSTGVSETLMPRGPTRGIAPSSPSARFPSAFAIARCVVVRWLRCTKISRLAHGNVSSGSILGHQVYTQEHQHRPRGLCQASDS